jgi:hypothetical protein
VRVVDDSAGRIAILKHVLPLCSGPGASRTARGMSRATRHGAVVGVKWLKRH